MNAARYLQWVRPLFGLPRFGEARAKDPALAFFLSLPQRLERAAGPGHFLESSATTLRGLDVVKLALILKTPPDALARDAARRDRPEKAETAARLLDALGSRRGGRYDKKRAEAVLEALGRWRLRGSLMVSCDFDRRALAFGKLSLYAYLPGPAQLPELLRPLGLEAHSREVERLAGPTLGFFGLDLVPDGGATLKFYNRERYSGQGLPEHVRAAAENLRELTTVRDVTRLTRVGADVPALQGGRAAPGPSPSVAGGDGRKVYLGFEEGVPLKEFGRVRCLSEHVDFFARLAHRAPGQRAYFLGFMGRELEVYFDDRSQGEA
ncbi:MAG: hypothetical protein ABII00_00150 [Elusimicrobiota bacterium]